MTKHITQAATICQKAMPNGMPPARIAIFASENASPQPSPIANNSIQGRNGFKGFNISASFS